MNRRILLVGCGAGKLTGSHPASLLYTGPLVKKSISYAIAQNVPWAILSAKYGLLHNDQIIDSYNLALSSLSDEEKMRWGIKVMRIQLPVFLRRYGMGIDLPITLEVHAGATYLDAIKPHIQSNWNLSIPLAGLPIGKRLAWYTRR